MLDTLDNKDAAGNVNDHRSLFRATSFACHSDSHCAIVPVMFMALILSLPLLALQRLGP